MAEYIDKEAALEIVAEWCPDDDGSVGKIGDLREMLDEIESIPAADVRPVVRGKWVLDSDPGEPWKYHCDQCGETTTDTCMGKPRANWCPLCGAYMGEEGETMRTQQQLRKRKYVSRDRVFIEFADWANETGATNTQNFSDRLRAIPTVDVSEDTKDV